MMGLANGPPCMCLCLAEPVQHRNRLDDVILSQGKKKKKKKKSPGYICTVVRQLTVHDL